MKRLIAIVMVTSTLLMPARNANAFFSFGGDLVLLGKILANAIQQLVQLRQVVSAGRDNLNLVRDINRGIQEALALGQTIDPNIDPGIYRDWQRLNEALQSLEQIYGAVTSSKDSRLQRDTDQSVAEAITYNNSLHSYTRGIDQVGEQFKNQSRVASPGGAQRLTAQSMGVLLQVMNQMLRAQGRTLKIQAQDLAIRNKHEKERTKHVLEASRALKTAMAKEKAEFVVPRF